MKSPNARTQTLISVALAANALLLPAYCNGYLFFFIDTGRHLSLDSFTTLTPPFYNFLLYPLYVWNLPWVVGLTQASVAAVLIWLALRACLGRVSLRTFGIVIAILTAATSLPFQARFALPDALTALGLLAIAVLPIRTTSASRGSKLTGSRRTISR